MKPDYEQDNIKLYNADCMTIMKEYPDKYFDLAVVDPPYGIERLGDAQDRFSMGKSLELVNDAKPNAEYFEELFRVSKNQIIWGYNHLSDLLPSCREFIYWYKHQPVVTFSDGELAWTSFIKTSKCFDYPFFGCHGSDKTKKIHPTQKPIKLYNWIYVNYSEPGQRILDTHLGSGSNAIAAHYAKMGEFVGVELDPDYFKASTERIYNETRQQDLF